MNLLHKNILLIVVFVTGACILIIELTALRVLTPYFGNTIFSATSVITTILLSLSIGYYVGGRLSDRRPNESLFYLLILSSGLLVLFTHLLINLLVPTIAYKLNIITGPLIISSILFLVPSLLLGMLSPFVITLQKKRFPTEGIGKVSGNVFFVSTLGSISGSLLTGFYLIPHFGAKQIILVTGLILVAVGAIGYFGGRRNNSLVTLIIIVLASVWLADGLTQKGSNVVYARDGVYTHIAVVDSDLGGRPVRYFMQDSSFASGMYLDGDDLAFEYSKYYELYKLVTNDLDNVYVIGAGTYSLPKAYSQVNDKVEVDVVDIEPNLEQLAKKYFELEQNDRITSHVTDGRRYLYDSDKSYDVIFGDVFFSLYSIPSQFTTLEFFELAKSRLDSNGVIILNIIGSLDERKDEFLLSEMKTFSRVFPNKLLFAVKDPSSDEIQNFVFVGSKSEVDLKSAFLASEFDDFKDKLVDVKDTDLEDYTTLTDDYAPVDFMNAKILLK